jgi:hypothetical protein
MDRVAEQEQSAVAVAMCISMQTQERRQGAKIFPALHGFGTGFAISRGIAGSDQKL